MKTMTFSFNEDGRCSICNHSFVKKEKVLVIRKGILRDKIRFCEQCFIHLIEFLKLIRK